MSERLYSLILQLYPRRFRERYAEEMMHVFRGRLHDEGAVRVWLDVLGDAVVSIPRQHIVREPHPYYPPYASPLRAANARMIQTMIVFLILGAVGGLVLGATFVLGFSKTWPLAALLLVAGGITARTACRTSALKAVRAEASNDAVTVGYAGVAPFTLQRGEVVGLREFFVWELPHDQHVGIVGLRIETRDSSRDLWIPGRLESYASVKAHLSEWVPVTPTIHPLIRVLTGFPGELAILYTLALFIPLTYFGLILYLASFVPALVRRDVPLHRKLLLTGAITILLKRWLG